MGRPLNKKYFGNRNIGTGGAQIVDGTGNSANTADDRIGGEGIADVTIPDAGNWLATAGGSNVPVVGLTLPAPTLPGGVQAEWSVTYGIEHVTTGAGSVGLVVGETYTSSSFPGSIITVATSGNNGTNATFTITNQGATGTIPTDLQGVNITLRPGLGYTGAATFLVDIFTHIKGVTITEKGSGYVGTETITPALANSATGSAPSGLAIVLTTDTGNVGSATYQENAIKMYANISGSGSTGALCDIIRQVSTRRYKVTDGTNTGIATLGTDDTPANGNGYIIATDANGNTYFVTKLTAHMATLYRQTDDGSDGDWVYASEQSAPWSFDAPTGIYVQIENA